MLAFSNRILFVGFGAVARCTLPILLDHIKVDPKRITIMDFEPNEAALRPWLEQGMTFVKDRVTPENLGTLAGHSTCRPATCSSTWPGTSIAARSCSGATTTACCTSTRRWSCGTRTPVPMTSTPPSGRSTGGT